MQVNGRDSNLFDYELNYMYVIRVLSRIYRLGEKSRVAEDHDLSGGVLGKFFEMNMR